VPIVVKKMKHIPEIILSTVQRPVFLFCKSAGPPISRSVPEEEARYADDIGFFSDFVESAL